MKTANGTFIILAFLYSLQGFAFRKMNNDIVNGKLLPPGPWEFFTYDTFGLLDSIDMDQLQEKIVDLKDEINPDGSADEYEDLRDYGNANFRKFIFMYHEHRKEFEKSYQSWLDKGRSHGQPIFSLKREKKFLDVALKSYRKLIFDFPKTRHRDQLFYNLSLLLFISKSDNTSLYLEKLLKKYPKSKLKNRARLLFASYFLWKKRYGRALKRIKKVTTAKSFKVRTYAKYIFSWVMYFRAVKTDKALAKNLQSAVLAATVQADQDAGKYLIKLGLGDLVKVWDQKKYIDAAKDFFNRVQFPKYYLYTLERLAKRLTANRKSIDAANVYHRILKISSTKPNSPKIHLSILKVYAAQKKYAQIIRTLEQMMRMYLKKSPWTAANKGQSGKVRNLVSKTLRRYILFLEQKVPKNSPGLTGPLIRLIERYLVFFPRTKHASNLKLRLARLYSKTKQFDKSTKIYEGIKKGLSRKSKKRYMVTKLAVEEFQKFIAESNVPGPTGDHPLPKAYPFPKPMRQMVERLEEFMNDYGTNPKDQKFRYILGEIYFLYGHYSKSIRVWNTLIKKFGSSSWAQKAILIINDFYLAASKWKEANSFGYKLVKEKKIKSKNVLDSTVNLIATSTFELGKRYKAKREYDDALSMYLKYHKSFPKKKLADVALLELHKIYGLSKRFSKQLEAGDRFIKLYQSSPALKKMLFFQADLYESILEINKSMNLMGFFVRKFPSDPNVATAFLRISLLQAASEKYTSAALTYLTYFEKFPNHKRTKEALHKFLYILNMWRYNKDIIDVPQLLQRANRIRHPDISLVMKVLQSIDSERGIQTTVQAIARSSSGSKKAIGGLLASYLLNHLKAKVDEENYLGLDPGANIKTEYDRKKARFKSMLAIHGLIRSLGLSTYNLAADFNIASLYAVFSQKIDVILKKMNAQDSAKFQSVVFELKEISKPYFERVSRYINRDFTIEGKHVYKEMHRFNPKFNPIDQVFMRPVYATYSIY